MQHRPITSDSKLWHNVSVKQKQISITGCYNHKGEVAESIQYQCADKLTYTFVALHKEAKWFFKGVGGTQQGDLKSLQVLQTIRQLVSEDEFVPTDAEPCPLVVGSDSPSSAAGASDEADDDPMDDLVSVESVAAAVADLVKKPSPKKRKIDRACVHELTLPSRPLCVGSGGLAETTIFVYRKPENTKNSVLYLRSDCLSWLLSYAADELSCQGVYRSDLNSKTIAKRPNCPAVADIKPE